MLPPSFFSSPNTSPKRLFAFSMDVMGGGKEDWTKANEHTGTSTASSYQLPEEEVWTHESVEA